MTEYLKMWLENHPNYYKDYYINKKVKLDAYHKQYVNDNKDKIKKYQRMYHKKYYIKKKLKEQEQKVEAFKLSLIKV